MSAEPAPRAPIERYLDVLLPLYWLRPESALWYAHELAAVGRVLGGRLEGPSLEFGCLDGINTFVLLGGAFSFDFDLYGGVRVRAGETARDYLAEAAPPSSGDVTTRPRDFFDVGLDYADSHLAKAAPLGLYTTLVRQDFDAPLSSYADASFRTIWAPMLFWVSRDRAGAMLAELRRVLAPGGRLVTMVPDERIAAWLVRTRAEGASPSWIDVIDRGKHAHFTKNARTRAQWERLFAEAGLGVGAHASFAPPVIVQAYDVGLRPMFPAMMKMYEVLKREAPEDVAQIKRHWVEVSGHFLRPLCSPAVADAPEDATWHVFELSRSA